MINELIQAVGQELYQEFGNGYTIYANAVKQGLQEPCFFVSCMNPARRRFFGNRYFRKTPFVIQYFPQNRNREREECMEVA